MRLLWVIWLLVLWSNIAFAQNQPRRWVWWEAEQPTRTNFPSNNPFAPENDDQTRALSEGKWIGTEGRYPQTLFLEYTVEVPEEGTYHFFARKFWKHGPFRWRFDDQPWRTCGREVSLLDEVPLRRFVVANWVALGKVQLSKGAHTLRIETIEPEGAIAFDAFLLSQAMVVPRGTLKPGERYNRSMPGWFAFEPDPDPFRPAPIDLRVLNEKVAGEKGRIIVREGQFVHSKTGEPVRFWGVNAGGDFLRLEPFLMEYLARQLAKQGVNLVRIHTPLTREGSLEIDPSLVRQVQQFVHAMRNEGIYTALSIYFPLWVRLKPEDGFGSYNNQHPFALLFIDERFQKRYREWWRVLLTSPNPITGIPLKDDPAVALIEIVNEDSYLFWTFTPYENIPAEPMAVLEKAFGEWLTRKYGSIQDAFERWGGERKRGDDPQAGRAGFINLYEIFSQRTLRAQDTAEFLTRHQRTFFEQTQRYLKQELGYQGLVQASNWITAEGRVLGPLDKWSNTVCDYMDRHGYFGGRHEGPNAGWSINGGDRYEDATALTSVDGTALPIQEVLYNGLPSIISEVNWTPPNRYRAEFPFLSATYGRLQGTDGIVFFALAGLGWQGQLTKFAVQTPTIMAQFPALALLFRLGLVQEAPHAVEVNLTLSDLFALKGAPVAQPMSLDALRAGDVPPGQTAQTPQVEQFDPLSHYVGKVQMNFVETPQASRIANLTEFIDRERKQVRSLTRELSWDYGKGLVILDGERAQGVCGFLSKASTISLSLLTFRSELEYGTLLLVPLDNLPLRESRRMLLQVMSEETQYGWQAQGEGLRTIQKLGEPPVLVRELQGSVTFRLPNAETLRITPLDWNGYPAGSPTRGAVLNLQPNRFYYLVER